MSICGIAPFQEDLMIFAFDEDEEYIAFGGAAKGVIILSSYQSKFFRKASNLKSVFITEVGKKPQDMP